MARITRIRTSLTKRAIKNPTDFTPHSSTTPFPVFILLLTLLILTSSCQTMNPEKIPHRGEEEKREGITLSPIQEQLIIEAHDLIGAEVLNGGGKTFRNDCTGTIEALYARVGIELGRELGKYSGNSVARLYKYLDEKQLLYQTKDPAPGDIIFWDNTWDANEDGKFNDPFTHAGVVINKLGNYSGRRIKN
ncbi:MAG: C40 family peptidase [Spirochaetales bacterium]|nr:C40 family peptidase [Spirochaetales bacterium]